MTSKVPSDVFGRRCTRTSAGFSSDAQATDEKPAEVLKGIVGLKSTTTNAVSQEIKPMGSRLGEDLEPTFCQGF